MPVTNKYCDCLRDHNMAHIQRGKGQPLRLKSTLLEREILDSNSKQRDNETT